METGLLGRKILNGVYNMSTLLTISRVFLCLSCFISCIFCSNEIIYDMDLLRNKDSPQAIQHTDLSNVSSLLVRGKNFQDLKGYIKKCTHLSSIAIWYDGYVDISFLELSQLSNISIKSCKLDKHVLPWIGNYKLPLIELVLDGCQLNDSSIVLLEKTLQTVKILGLRGNYISNNAIRFISSHVQCLQSLLLSNNSSLTKFSLDCFPETIEIVEVAFCPLDQDMPLILCKKSSLKELWISAPLKNIEKCSDFGFINTAGVGAVVHHLVKKD